MTILASLPSVFAAYGLTIEYRPENEFYAWTAVDTDGTDLHDFETKREAAEWLASFLPEWEQDEALELL